MSEIQHRENPAAHVVPYLSEVVFDQDYAFLSGQAAADSNDPEVELGDIEAETHTTMRLLAESLDGLGLSFADVVCVKVYLTKPELFDRMNAVYRRYFEPGKLPARTCIGVTWIFGDSLVEIDCIARRRG